MDEELDVVAVVFCMAPDAQLSTRDKKALSGMSVQTAEGLNFSSADPPRTVYGSGG